MAFLSLFATLRLERVQHFSLPSYDQRVQGSVLLGAGTAAFFEVLDVSRRGTLSGQLPYLLMTRTLPFSVSEPTERKYFKVSLSNHLSRPYRSRWVLSSRMRAPRRFR
jgi:hypothetical protein